MHTFSALVLLLSALFYGKEIYKMKKKKAFVLKLILLLLLIFAVVCIVYVNIYYHAEDVSDALTSSDTVTVAQFSDGWFFDGSGENSALIFYPGAKVEASAYAPLMHMFSESGIDCFLVKMPCNLAFLGSGKAENIMKKYDYEHWYIGGHSLGGAMAADYAAGHSSAFDGLVLLASYSAKDLSDASFPVLSIYGSEDGVLNMDKVESSRKFMPLVYGEHIITGGNHAWFGSYGEQKGDGTAAISHEEQWQETVNYILGILEK